MFAQLLGLIHRYRARRRACGRFHARARENRLPNYLKDSTDIIGVGLSWAALPEIAVQSNITCPFCAKRFTRSGLLVRKPAEYADPRDDRGWPLHPETLVRLPIQDYDTPVAQFRLWDSATNKYAGPWKAQFVAEELA